MRSRLELGTWALLLGLAFLPLAARSGGIKHVIVLMLENRSVDHMLGFLKQKNPDVRGCLPGQAGCSNHVDPKDTSSASYTVDNEAVYVQADPSHSISATTSQIYGYPEGTEPTMDGFLSSYASRYGDPDLGPLIMKCFAPEHVPVISTLASEFGFFDGWHASVPGPTMVNRAYAGSATSAGMGTNDEKTIALGMSQKTVFRQLQEMGRDYRVYWSDVPSVLMFKDMRHRDARPKYRQLNDLFVDLAAGDMPEFTWVEPAYFDTPHQAATDQHPAHDVTLGEDLIKRVYEAVRASPIWEETAFIVTYDEHGGFFDHVVPPDTNVPNPDGKNSTDDPFDFTRLGIRIPTVVASPYIPKGSVFHAPDELGASQYEHSSIIATVVHKLFSPKPGHAAPEFLTKRDAWAKTFEGIFDFSSPPRQDCPETLPSPISLAEVAPSALPMVGGSKTLSDLQRELLAVVVGAAAAEGSGHFNEELFVQLASNMTEAEAGTYCLNAVKNFLMN